MVRHDYESEKEKAKRERSERIQKEIGPMLLSAFTVAELPAVMVFLGFRLDSHANCQFLTAAEAENLLEQKLLRLEAERAERDASLDTLYCRGQGAG